MFKISEITSFLDEFAPALLKENYDNVGLLIGDKNDLLESILLTLDITEKVIDEAISKKCNLIISHHPILFKSLKKIGTNTEEERIIRKAIKHDISIYASHTNLDNIKGGVNFKLAEKINLKNIKILNPKSNNINRIISFCPEEYKDLILNELYKAGAGNIGNYKNCSYSSEGTGTFLPTENANPFEGNIGIESKIKEVKIEVLVPNYLTDKVLRALKKSHPYEEVAYYIHDTENTNQDTGIGAIGELENEIDEIEFLKYLKTVLPIDYIRHTELLNKKIKTVAVCGGSGAFLTKKAISEGADVFISADFKYHDYFEAEKKILIADIGHYETEICTKELFYEVITKKFSNIVVLISDTVTKPYNYI